MAASYSETETVADQARSPDPSLGRYWRPRYWPAWVLVGWLRLAASLPWHASIAIHRRVGDLCWLLLGRRRRVVERNLELGMPELDAVEIKALVRRHFQSLAACIAETAYAWSGRVDDSLARIEIEGAEHVRGALEAGCGVILSTGHFTPMEICGPVLKQTFPLVGFMFNRRRNELIDEVQRRGRSYAGHIPISSGNSRSMLRALRRNAVIWYASDQSFSNRSGVALPFLGEQIMANTAAYRLARASGAAIVPMSYCRLPDDSGYRFSFGPAVQCVGADDEERCTRELLVGLEQSVREHPDQYAWTPNRLRHRLADAAAAV